MMNSRPDVKNLGCEDGLLDALEVSLSPERLNTYY